MFGGEQINELVAVLSLVCAAVLFHSSKGAGDLRILLSQLSQSARGLTARFGAAGGRQESAGLGKERFDLVL